MLITLLTEECTVTCKTQCAPGCGKRSLMFSISVCFLSIKKRNEHGNLVHPFLDMIKGYNLKVWPHELRQSLIENMLSYEDNDHTR